MKGMLDALNLSAYFSFTPRKFSILIRPGNLRPKERLGIKAKGPRVTAQNSSYELREPVVPCRGVFGATETID